MKDREEILLQTIRLHKLNIDRFKRLVAVHERELNQAEAALKRLNEGKKADRDVGVPSERRHEYQRED